jgi:hypothetical protein
MVCSVGPSGGRARWRADGADADQSARRRARRALLADAKRAGVSVPRGLPDDKVRAMIAQAADPQPPAATRPVTVASRVVDTISGLAPAGDLVSLAALRDQLPGVARADVDAALVGLDRAGVVQLEPDPNRRTLSDRAKAAAFRFGGEDVHLVCIRQPVAVGGAR